MKWERARRPNAGEAVNRLWDALRSAAYEWQDLYSSDDPEGSVERLMAAGIREEAAVFIVQQNLWGIDAIAVALPQLSPSVRRWRALRTTEQIERDASALVGLLLRGADLRLGSAA